MARMSRRFYVYLLTNRSQRSLYTGITNNLSRRMVEHKRREVPGFTAKYNLDRLLYCEVFYYSEDAIAREKQIKGWTRKKKEALIAGYNPERVDLSEGIVEE